MDFYGIGLHFLRVQTARLALVELCYGVEKRGHDYS
jgi:hypothetical protein